MKKGAGSESTIITGPSKSVLVYALHSLEYFLGLARFRVFVPKLLLLLYVKNDYAFFAAQNISAITEDYFLHNVTKLWKSFIDKQLNLNGFTYRKHLKRHNLIKLNV